MSERLVLPQRPGSVIAAAVLALIYGSLFLICGLCGVAGLAMQGMQPAFGAANPQQAQMQKQMKEDMERDVPGYQIVQIATVIVGLGLSLAILVAGIGLLGMHSWARKLAVIAALIAVASAAFQTIYQIVFIIPATTNAMAAALPGAMAKGPGQVPPPGAAAFGNMMQAMGPLMGFMTVVFYVAIIAYLLIIVFLLQRRRVRAAFAAWGLPVEPQERPEREQEGDDWRPSTPRNPEDDTRYR